MPSKSLEQRRAAGAALSVKRGRQKLEDLPPGLRSIVKSMLSMSEEQLEDFARGSSHRSGHRKSRGDTIRKVRSA